MELWSVLKAVDASLLPEDTTRKAVESKKDLRAYLDHCCVRRNYFFAIKKCGDVTCKICGPPTLPAEAFQQLHPFPDPEVSPSNKEHYRSFADSWGRTTSEKDRPSFSQSSDRSTCQLEGVDFALTREKVRDFVHCEECLKPRCIFSNRALTHQQEVQVGNAKADYSFVCGSKLLPADHDLATAVVVNHSLTCNSHAEKAYYTSRRCFEDVCFVCGSDSPLLVTQEMKQQYQSVHPVCEHCHQSGKRP